MKINWKIVLRCVGVWVVTVSTLNLMGLWLPSMALGIAAGSAGYLMAQRVEPRPWVGPLPTSWECPQCHGFRITSNDPGVVAKYRNKHAELHLLLDQEGL